MRTADRGPLQRLLDVLSEEGISQAVLSSPISLSHLAGFDADWDDWPVGDPFTAAPPLLVLREREATVVVPRMLAYDVSRCNCEVVVSATSDFRNPPPDPVAALELVFESLELSPVPTAVEAGSLPLRVAEILSRVGAGPVDITALLVRTRMRKLPCEVEAIRHASALADRIQRSVKEHAAPGMSEAELAGRALADVYALAGRRVPAVLTINAGVGSTLPTTPARGRTIEAGDVILTDTQPWVDGAWSDTANSVVVGAPDGEQQRLFDDLRRALEIGIAAARPGNRAADVDRLVRESLARHGADVYAHHTGHGIGAAWNEPPAIVPFSEEVIDEGMVLAIEPSVYRPGRYGMRIEHVFHVGSDGNEILTGFEHTL
ncbi:MAG TPA: Xaa-Pro peptidase family protein [Solirubrobacterales bacterium]